MTPERWREIAEIGQAALDQSEDRRSSFVAEACAGNDELRREVLSLLQYAAAGENFLPTPRPAVTDSATRLPSSLIGIDLGSYRVQSLLGMGGMGAVYAAYDPRLQRTVAIKVLPEAFAADTEWLQRFEREGRAAALLNHPNILAVYDVGRHDGRPYIVMELVPGETLADLLRRGRVSVERALEIGAAIADALAAAHAKGVLHRDLKPSNVMVTHTGHVKVLDFGLAKMLASEITPSDEGTVVQTQPSRLLGTPAYMSPERLRGQSGDHRADIFSLGVIVFELLTGRRPFEGNDLLALISNVITQAPPLASDLEPSVPSRVSEFVAQMLSKEPSRRPSSAALVKIEFDRLRRELPEMPSSSVAAKLAHRTRTIMHARWLPYATVAAVAATLATSAYLERFSTAALVPSHAAHAVHRQITFVGDARHPAVSPDGQFLAYIAGPDGAQTVIVHDLTSSHSLEVLKGPRFFEVRWSPDGANMLVSGSPGPEGLYLIPRLGGPARRLPGNYRVAWSPDGSQIVSVDQGSTGRLSFTDVKTGATRTTPLPGPFGFLLQVDWSPSGEWLLLVAVDEAQRASLWVVKPDGTQQQKLHEEETGGLRARWGPGGDTIYYLRGEHTQELVKLAFVPRSGKPTLLLTGLEVGWSGAMSGLFDVLRDGKRLAYTRSSAHSNLWLASFGRGGTNQDPELKPLSAGTRTYYEPKISPDGNRLTYSMGDSKVANIFVLPIEGGSPRQLTFLNSQNRGPVWSPNGQSIAFASIEGGSTKVWHVAADGSTPPRAFSRTSVSPHAPMLEWAPGADILYPTPNHRNFSMLNPVTGHVVPVLHDERAGWIMFPRFSPDGKEIAAYWNRWGGEGLYVLTLQGALVDNERPYRRVAGKTAGGTTGSISQSADVSPYRGKEFKLTAHIKTAVTGGGNAGQCWARVNRAGQQVGFVDNMDNRPIVSPSWGTYDIVGKFDDDAEQLLFGCFLAGVGELRVDQVELFFRNDGTAWAPIQIKNPGFEGDAVGGPPSAWRASSSGYDYQIRDDDPFRGQKSLVISKTPLSPTAYWPIGWSADGKSIFAFDHAQNVVVTVPVAGGVATPHTKLAAVQTHGVGDVTITPDGRRVVYTLVESRSDVWIVENFDPSVP